MTAWNLCKLFNNAAARDRSQRNLLISNKINKPHASLLSIIISIIYSHNYNNHHIMYPNHSLGNSKQKKYSQNKIKDPYGSKERQDLINFLPLTFLHSSLIFLPFFSFIIVVLVTTVGILWVCLTEGNYKTKQLDENKKKILHRNKTASTLIFLVYFPRL